MVQDRHLSCEASCFRWRVIFAVTSHIATKNIFDSHVLEAHIVPRRAITQSITVHFKRLKLFPWLEQGDHIARFENTRLCLTHRDSISASTTNFVAIQEEQTQGLISWAGWWQGAVWSLRQYGSVGIAIFVGDLASLERQGSTWFQQCCHHDNQKLAQMLLCWDCSQFF